MRSSTYRVNSPGLHVAVHVSLDLVQVLQLGLVVGGEGVHVPGVLHDPLHCDPLLHIRHKDAVQQAPALGRQLQASNAHL